MNNTQIRTIKMLESAIQDVKNDSLYPAKSNIEIADTYIDFLIYDKVMT